MVDEPIARGKTNSGNQKPNEVLIEHAARLWQAECENASRIASRIQIIAGVIIALLGLGLFNFEWFYQIPSAAVCPPAVVVIVHGLLALVVLSFGLALGRIFLRPDNGAGHASEKMELHDEDAGESVRRLAFIKTYAAYYELKERNQKEKLRLRRGQAWFQVGVGLLFLAVLVYLFGSIGAKIYLENPYEHTSRSSSSDRKSPS